MKLTTLMAGIASAMIIAAPALAQQTDKAGLRGWHEAGSGSAFNDSCEYRALIDSQNPEPNHYYYMGAVAEHELVFFSDSDTFRITPAERYRWVRLSDGKIWQVIKLERRC